MTSTIPPITDALGRSWKQPLASEITFMEDSPEHTDYACIGPLAFAKLAEYSASYPTSVYEGKMWKRQQDDGWWLLWYDHSPKPKTCTIKSRRLVIQYPIGEVK